MARRLDDDVDAELAPWQVRGIALGEHLQLRVAGLDRPVADLDPLVQRPEHRVVLEQVPIVFASPRSLTATISKSPSRSRCARKKFRPMRPKPLMPTRVAISQPPNRVAFESSKTPPPRSGVSPDPRCGHSVGCDR